MKFIRLTLAMLVFLPLGAQHYYIVGSSTGLGIKLAEAPGMPSKMTVRLPVPTPPTAQAQAMAQAELDGMCSVAWEVALSHDPERSNGYSDVYLLSGPNGWRPKVRLSAGGNLITFGLVAAPKDVGGALQDVYEQAFVNAVANREGWYQQLGPDGGRNAWIVGNDRMIQYFELLQILGAQRQPQQKRPFPPTRGRVTIPDKPEQSLTSEQQRQVDQYREKGILFDPVKMTIKRIDPQPSN